MHDHEYARPTIGGNTSLGSCVCGPTDDTCHWFFAYTGVDIDGLRSNLPSRPGDPWTGETNQLLRSELEELLGRSPSDVTAVCWDEDGNRIVYIGLADGSGLRGRFHPQPTESLELCADLVILYDRFEEAVRQAVAREVGLVLEDRSLGYSLSHDADVRGLQ